MPKPSLHQPNLLLKRARLERGWSQQEVADLLEAPQAFMVTRWENGVIFPGPGYRKKLCTLFEKSLEELGLVKPTHLSPDDLDPPRVQGPIYDPAVPVYLARQQQLIGRDTLLEEIIDRLQNASSRKVALSGLPGIGKTTLVTVLATHERVRELFPDGVLWAELGSKPQLSSMFSRWSTLLGISRARTSQLHNMDEWVHALRDAIGTRRFLVILDDAWTIEEVLAHMVAGPQCAYLLTTRLPEVATRFAGRQVVHVPELGLTESVEMLTEYAPMLKETNEEDLHALTQAVGGLPLALKLIGMYLMLQTRHHQTRRFQAALTNLQQATVRLHLATPQAGLERDLRLPPGTPLTLQAMIELSEEMLTTEEQQALYALSIFPSKPHSFSEEAALAVMAAAPEVLDRLIDTGFVEVSEADRYQLHQTIADYAQSKRAGQQVERRLVEYVMQYIDQHQNDNAELDRESHIIITALDCTRALDAHEIYLQMLLKLLPYLQTSKPYNVTEHYLRQAYWSARTYGHQRYLMRIALHLGEAMREQGNMPEAEAILREGLTFAEPQDQRYSADLLLTLGTVLAEQHNYQEAQACMDEALARAEQAGDQEQIAKMYGVRALLAFVTSKIDLAESLLLKASTLQSDTTTRQFATTLANLGMVYLRKENFARASHYLLEGLHLIQTHKYRDLVFLIEYLALLETNQGHFMEAKAYYLEAIEQAKSLHLQRGLFDLLIGVSQAAIKMGDFALSMAYQQEASALLPPNGLPGKKSRLPALQGIVALEQGDLALAQTSLQEALDMARLAKRPNLCSEYLILLGLALQRQGDYQTARSSLQQGLDLALTLNMSRLIGEARLAWGEYYLLQQDNTLAQSQFAEVLTTIPHEFQELIARAYAGLASVSNARQQYQEARSQGEIALALFEKMQHTRRKEMRSFLDALP